MRNIGLILISVSLSAAAQLCMRKLMLQTGAVSFEISFIKHLPFMFTNIFFWLGLLFYGSGLFFWLIVLSKTDISFAYLFTSLNFVVITVMGHLLFGEHISLMRTAGLVLICLGLCVIAGT
ncbi:MAG: 4-amino-4-deoxy-L-arabinose transferase [Spirochaetaceae bacterium]|jgi:multidrug transporter EmrE-like cation transporter|nr:4-amino-4-deoxy-L-arabinose transferase [Spirochaetaceae bacterium]